jgi:hypothetical protein
MPTFTPRILAYDSNSFRMPSRSFLYLIPALILVSLAAQVNPRQAPTAPAADEPLRLPNGKLQSDEILKAEHEKSVQDAKSLVELAQSLEKDLDQQSSAQVLSLADIHKTEEIEKLAKRIRTRIRQ